jgi:hypothetical protein
MAGIWLDCGVSHSIRHHAYVVNHDSSRQHTSATNVALPHSLQSTSTLPVERESLCPLSL